MEGHSHRPFVTKTEPPGDLVDAVWGKRGTVLRSIPARLACPVLKHTGSGNEAYPTTGISLPYLNRTPQPTDQNHVGRRGRRGIGQRGDTRWEPKRHRARPLRDRCACSRSWERGPSRSRWLRWFAP